MNISLLIIPAYFVFIIIISFTTRKISSSSSSSFLVAGRNLGLATCAAVVAAEWLGGMSTIGVSEKAFTLGSLQPALYNIATATGMVIIGFTVASFYRKNNVHTVSEMLQNLFGKKIRGISAIPFLIAYITLGFVQLQSCAGVISGVLGINWYIAILISSVIITTYTYIGGMHAIALTNVLHLLVMFLGIGLAFVIGIGKIGGFSMLKSQLIVSGSPSNPFNPFDANLGYAFSLLLGGILGGMAAQASIQPIFAAKDPTTAKRAAIASAFIIAPFGIMTAFLGMIARVGNFFDVDSITNTKMILPTLLMSENFIHPVLGSIALAGILAAILSTVAPVNFAVVTIAAKDIYQGIQGSKVDDRRVLKIARKLVILVNLIILPLAIFSKGAVLDNAYISYAIRAIGAIVIVFAIYRKGWINLLGASMAFIGGTLAIFVFIIAKNLGWFTIDKTYGAIAAAIFFIILGKVIEIVKKRRK